MSQSFPEDDPGFVESDAAGHCEKIFYSDFRAENLVKGVQLFLENVVNVLVQRKLAFLNQKTNCHAGDAFAHGMGHVPDPAAVGGKIGLADDLSISENLKWCMSV